MVDPTVQSPIGAHSLPPAIHILAAFGLAAGLVFWSLGWKLLKPAFAVLGGIAGGFVGFFLFPTFAPATVFGAPSPYIGLGAGLALGLVIGITLYRFAVSIITAAAFALAGVLIAATVIHFGPLQNIPQAIDNGQAQAAPPAAPGEQPHATEVLAEQVRSLVTSGYDGVAKKWSELPSAQQLMVVVAGLAGAGLGFIVGASAPRRSAAVSTALFGSAVWLPMLVWLLYAIQFPGRQFLERGGEFEWLVVWLTLAALGFAFQIAMGRRASKAAAQ